MGTTTNQFDRRRTTEQPTALRQTSVRRAAAVAVEHLEARLCLTAVDFTKAEIETAGKAVAIAAADLNADGRPDVAYLTATGQPVAHLNQGRGGFGPAIASPVSYGSPGAFELAVADVTGDGRPDLVTTYFQGNSVVVYRGVGDGSFAAPTTYAVGAGAYDVAAGDVNGDGRVDLVVVNATANTLSLLTGAAGGGLNPAVTVAAGAAPRRVAVGDIDADGKADVVVANTVSGLTLLHGNGDGTFVATAVSAPYVGPEQTKVVIADVDNDARPDLVIGVYGIVPLTVFRNLGGGSFSSGATYGYGSGQNQPFAATLTNDGNLDLLYGNDGGDASSFTGVGGGAFESGGGNFIGGVIAVADFDGDGLSDVATAGGTTPRLSVSLSKPIVGSGASFSSAPFSHVLTNVTMATCQSNIAPNAPVTGVTATIDWGDGRTSAGTVVPAGNGQFTVTASHTFPYNQGYTYTVRVTMADGRTFPVATGTVDVRTAPPGPTINEFPTSPPRTPAPGNHVIFPDQVAAGPGGDVWFTAGADYQTSTSDPRSAAVGRVNVNTGAVSWVTLPTTTTAAAGRPLASDGAGNAWVSISGSTIGRVDAAGVLTTYPTPVAPTGGFARGPDGAIWFTVASPAGTGSFKPIDRIARIATTGPSVGSVKVVGLDQQAAGPTDMVAGPDGNLWLAQVDAHTVTRITLAGAVTTFALPGSSPDPGRITAGPDGNLWFTMQSARAIGRITPAGAVTIFNVRSGPVDVATGPDGSMWYTGYGNNTIGRITVDGVWSEYTTPTKYNAYPGLSNNGAYPYGIVAGGDGNVWFTEMAAGTVARVNLTQAAILTPTPVTAARKNVPFEGEVARFADATPGAASDYDATINWGDGTTSAGTLVAVPGGYAVRGSHTYTAEAALTMTVTLTPWADVPVTTTAPVVVDYPLSALATYNVFGTEGKASDPTPLLTFHDPDPDGTLGPFVVTINWGDGQTSTVTTLGGGVVAGSAPDLLNVNANHAYAREGTYPITLTVKDLGTTLSATTTARVAKSLLVQPAVGYDAAAGRVAVGDFNGDGIADVASAGSAGGRVDVLFGIGAGTLGQARAAATVGGTVVRALAAGDFNRDGRADLAVAVGDAASPPVEVYLGNADGSFTAGASVAARSGSLLVADLNGDGKLDLATASADAAGLVVALGNGAGGFAASTVTLAGGAPSLALADLDRDGKLDLAAGAVGTAGVRVLRGNGDGTFVAAVDYAGAAAAGTAPAYVAAGDLTGDGAADLAVADAAGNALYVLTNSGTGTFGPAAAYKLDEAVAAGTAAGPIAGLLAADVNADGVADLLRGANEAAGRLNVRLGQGAGAYRPVQTDTRLSLNLTSLSADAPAVAAADLNGDGRVDLITSGGGRVVVLINTPYSATSPVLSVVEGTAYPALTVGTITHEDPPTSAVGMTATVDWGDGTSSAATLTANASGGLNVVAGHAYRRAGTYTTRTTVTDAAGLRTVTTGTAIVSNAAVAVAAKAFAATINAPVTAVVATFSDANPFSQLSDFSATIDWGNGRVTTGIVRADAAAGAGKYTVTGTQTYAASGSFTVKVTVTDAAPSTFSTGSAVATVKPLANGGGSIAGTFYNDLNFDGVRDAAEPPLFAFTAYVDANNNGAFDAGEPSALSSSAGTFTIADVAAGTWTVRQVPPDDAWRQTSAAAGTGLTVTVTPGQQSAGAVFLDTRRPAALLDVGPAVRGSPLDSVTVRFSEPVTGFDLADLVLTRDGVAVPLAGGAAGGPTVQTSDNVRFTVGHLSALTTASGSYALTLTGPGSGIKDAPGHELAVGVTSGVTVTAPPTIVSWASAGVHGRGVGEVALPIPDDGTFSEPRASGISTLLVTFSDAVSTASFAPAAVGVWGTKADGSPVDLSGVTVTTSTRAGDTVGVISFSPALTDYARYLVRLSGMLGADGQAVAGDADRVLTALLGDATGDRRLNSTDVGAVTSLRGLDPIDRSDVNQVRSDVTNDGRVNSTDVGGVTSVRGKDARFIPDPVPAGTSWSAAAARMSVGTPAETVVLAEPAPAAAAAPAGGAALVADAHALSASPQASASPSIWSAAPVEDRELSLAAAVLG